MTWNETKEQAQGDELLSLVVNILEDWMEYCQDEERDIELDAREDMKSDIMFYRQKLQGFMGSGGGKF